MNPINNMMGFRAEQLCIMHFTRSDEFKLVSNFNHDSFLSGRTDPHLDLLFDVSDGAFYKGFNLGVSLKAGKTKVEIDKLVSNFKTAPFRNRIFPVVLVAFDVTSDKGYYAWINLPLNLRELKTIPSIPAESLKPLNSKALKDMIAKIDLFYFDPNRGWQ